MARSHWAAAILMGAAALLPGCDTDGNETESNANGDSNGDDNGGEPDASDGEGIAMCEEIGTTCHDSSSERGMECHEIGHDLLVDGCRENYDECIELCEAEARGHGEDGGHNDEDGGHEHEDGGHHEEDAGHHDGG